MAEAQMKMIAISDLHQETGAAELVRSDDMKVYLELLKAEMAGVDPGPALKALAALPLTERYVWRVISALKWALCDLDTENVAADMKTLSEQDLAQVAEPIALRAMQFSLFVKALMGDEAGRAIMEQALACQVQ